MSTRKFARSLPSILCLLASSGILIFRLKNKLSVINSNIEDIDQIKSNSVDYIISTYNPLSFCNKPQLAVKEAFRVLKINGVAL
ncbi:MAG TPA: methyltransferase domain-containing protein, partial [Catalimonadaceae bacterium]|nr:methyltransferase domain-containing protein [Catalimonadaceae bacterium]